MNPTNELKKRTWRQFNNLLAMQAGVVLSCVVTLVLALAVRARAETPPSAIPISDIGSRATADYHGDALGITATSDGARLRCGFQKLECRATIGGLWLESTKRDAVGKLRLVAAALGREGGSTVSVQKSTILPATGAVSLLGKTVRFARPGVTEEYSVSVDGVRQDFVIAAPPAGAGDLRVEMALTGARAEATAGGVRIKLDGSGRELAYGRLQVEDATGRELTAQLEVVSADRLAVSVGDANATFPVRIDPTFSDADWVTLNPGLPGANSTVLAIATDDSGNVYVGGYFTFIGMVPVNYVAKWDGSSWSALGSGVGGGPHPEIFALAVSGTNLYAGGDFYTAGGAAATFVAKWDGNAWSALGAGLNNGVYALAVSGTNLYVGGGFTTAGGVSANSIAKWDGSAWSALGSGMNGQVRGLAASGTTLYAGGTFSTAGGVPANAIARWDGNTWSALGSGISNNVGPLAVSGANLYVDTYFISAGGLTTNSIAKWDGSTWSALGPAITGYVYALAASGPTVYAGGVFTDAGGAVVANIVEWNGSAWTGLGSGINNAVYALAVNGTNLYAGGSGTTAGGVAATCIARWDGNAWSAMGAAMGIAGLNNPDVKALAVRGTGVYAGGSFNTAGGVQANYVARWDGNAWSALGSGMGGTIPGVSALALGGNSLYAGGSFTTAGGVPANYIAKWNGSNWSALGSGMSTSDYGYVNALLVNGTNLYAGGSFSTAGGVPASFIAKWNGSAWSALGSGLSGGVSALAASGTNLYAGGSFAAAGGLTVNYIARWNGSAWSALGSGLNGGVSALAVSGTNLYAGGYFTTAGGVAATNIARWDGKAWSALGSGLSSNVLALAVSGTNLYAGGYFTAAGGVPVNYIAKWNGSAWSVLGSGVWGHDPETSYSAVRALAADGTGHLFVGGYFYMAGTNVSPFIAMANIPDPPILLSAPQTQTAEMGATVDFRVDAAGLDLTYELFFNGTNLLSTGSNGSLKVSNVGFLQSGAYTVVVTSQSGAVTSAPVMLNVIPAVPRWPVPALNLIAQPGSSLGVDYCDDLGPSANWATMATMTLSNSSQFYCDASQPLPPQRFYRAWQSGSPDVVPSLSLPGLVPAITVTGNIGDTLRVDYINQFGPTDAWVTLGTVTLTNTSQLYFDTSVFGQPARLWRIVPVP